MTSRHCSQRCCLVDLQLLFSIRESQLIHSGRHFLPATVVMAARVVMLYCSGIGVAVGVVLVVMMVGGSVVVVSVLNKIHIIVIYISGGP